MTGSIIIVRVYHPIYPDLFLVSSCVLSVKGVHSKQPEIQTNNIESEVNIKDGGQEDDLH